MKNNWYFCFLLIVACSSFAVKREKRPLRRCPHCHFKPARHATLKRHILIHAAQKAYTCPYSGCNHATFNPDGIKKHFKNKHPILEKAGAGAAVAVQIAQQEEAFDIRQIFVLPEGPDPIIDAIVKASD